MIGGEWIFTDVGTFPNELEAVRHIKRFGKYWPILSIVQSKRNYRLWIPTRYGYSFRFASTKLVAEVMNQSYYLIRLEADNKVSVAQLEKIQHQEQ